jgi:hypothetical protein
MKEPRKPAKRAAKKNPAKRKSPKRKTIMRHSREG